MVASKASFIGMPLPRNALHLVSNPLARCSSREALIRNETLQQVPSIHMAARKVSDIRYYPEQTKEERRARRVKEKREARKEKVLQRGKPRGFGDRPGVGIGPLGSPQRTIAEREARLKYTEGAPGSREIARRITRQLSGGKADHLLHVLRARWLERMGKEEVGEEVVLTPDIEKVYLRLIDEILLCDSLYYAENPKPRIEDWQYDELIMHLLELERWFPELIVPESPSQNVGHGAAVRSSKLALDNDLHSAPMTALESTVMTVPLTEKRFPQYRHKALMLSLDNAYRRDDLLSFFKRAHEANSKISAELKIDGIALSLEYRKRKLYNAATRGTGRIGDEVTENVRAALVKRGIVETILDPSAPDLLIVRGEVYITPQDFEMVNAGLDRKLSNPRNAAAGAIKHKDPLEAKARMLRFIAYECLTGNLEELEKSEESNGSEGPASTPSHVEVHNTLPTQEQTFHQLAQWGFGEMPRHEVCEGIAEAESFALTIEQDRGMLPLEVDGVVFKFEDSGARESSGHTARAPRGAIAYKFAAQSKVTTVLDVVMQVSRNGVITPVAVLEPVQVGGALLSRATLHNFDEINRLQVAIGDKVRVERGGDVIPKIVEVEQIASSSTRKVIGPPTTCPSCFGEVTSEVDGKTETTVVTCKNADFCIAQLHGRVLHFAGKEAMDIKGLGKKTADKLIKAGLVVVLADLFRLTRDDLLTLEGFAEKSVATLLTSIQEAASQRSLERLINGLGLPGVGRTGARQLASRMNSLEALISLASDEAGVDKLLSIPNFAEKSAQALHSYLRQERCQSELSALKQLIVSKAALEEEEYAELDLQKDLTDVAGKSFVFTGKLSRMSRPEVKKWILSAGGMVSTDVTSKTDYVVVGLDPGHKYFKAQRLKIKTLHEEEFLELFKSSHDDTTVLMSKS